MKKLVFLLLSLIAMFAGVSTMESCAHKSGHRILHTVDSTDVANQLEEFVNPSFYDGHSAYIFAQKLLLEKYQDSVFLSLPEEKLVDICSVLSKTHKPLNISSIVEEYESGKKIYDNVSGNHNVPESSVSEQYQHLSPAPDDDTNAEMRSRSKDTVIDGKSVTIITND